MVRNHTNRLNMNSSPSPDKLRESSEASEKPPADAAPAGSAGEAPASIKSSKPKAAKKPSVAGKQVPVVEPPSEFAVLRMTLFSLFTISIIVGLAFAWTGYSNRYAQVTEGWHIGQTKLIEITVVREDKDRLACASDVTVEDIHCGYHSNGQPFEQHTQNDSHVISPFNTVKNELFLGAGLWTSLAEHGPVPTERFTAACNYRIQGVLKSVGLRWQASASFDPVKQSVTVGTLSNCVIPK